MLNITVSVQVMGMSGKVWYKTGTFNEPILAADFLESWWHMVSLAEGWTLEINDLPYDTPPYTHARALSHIRYCCDLHHAFYFPDEIPVDKQGAV